MNLTTNILIIAISSILIGTLIIFKNQLKKILFDTLTDDKGKFQKKNIQMLVSFVIATAIGFIIVFMKDLNPYAIDVFWGFLAVSTGMAALTVWDKIKSKNSNSTPS